MTESRTKSQRIAAVERRTEALARSLTDLRQRVIVEGTDAQTRLARLEGAKDREPEREQQPHPPTEGVDLWWLSEADRRSPPGNSDGHLCLDISLRLLRRGGAVSVAAPDGSGGMAHATRPLHRRSYSTGELMDEILAALEDLAAKAED